MQHKSNSKFERSADIGRPKMEDRPNSNPENSAGIRTESPILPLTEHFVINSVMTRWDGPTYTSYSTNGAGLSSFVINN